MITTHKTLRRLALTLPACLTVALFGFSTVSQAEEKPASASGDMVPLQLKLPAPAFKGTPKDIQLSAYVEPLSDKPRPPMMGMNGTPACRVWGL